ncbi:MAG TPA: hypothetical protein VF702_01750 [Allosphingosinicella sp.]|jgi:hypothetical protein
MIPDPITWGHVLMLAGVLALLYAAWQLLVWARHRGHGRGSPQHARARGGRRHAIGSAAAGALLYAAGCFTPLCQAPLA